MGGNGKVFVSHTHEDNERCAPWLAALDAWGVNYWFDTQQLDAGQQLSDRIQRALAERDVLLRICTRAAERSYWMSLEATAFAGLQMADSARGKKASRTTIHLILDADYPREQLTAPGTVIDATSQSRPAALLALRNALGLRIPTRRISRRAALGLGSVAAGGIAALSATGTLALSGALRRTPAAKESPALAGPTEPVPQLDPRVRWHFDTDVPLFAVGDGKIFVTSEGESLYALDARDGSVRWRNSEIACVLTCAPIYADGVVYAADYSKWLLALDARDGSVRWRPQFGYDDMETTPFAMNGVIYARATLPATTTGSHLFAIRAADGTMLWSAPLGSNELAAKAAPTGANGVVYAGYASTILAFDAATGAPLGAPFTANGNVGQPVVAGGLVYFGTDNHYVYALNSSLDPHPVWQTPDLGIAANMSHPPVVANGAVYIGSADGYLYAFDAATGTQRWKVPANAPIPFSGTPTPGVPTPTPDGSLPGTEVYVQPAVADGVVYVNNSGELLAFDAGSGKLRWHLPVTAYAPTNAQVLADGGMVYLTTGNAVYAVAPAS